MQFVGDVYHDLISKYLVPQPPEVPFYSSVKAKVLLEASDFGPKYWQENLESPVLFHSAVRYLLSESRQCSVHLEVGPHSSLCGPLKQIYKETSTSIQYVSTLVRNQNDTESFLKAVGQLHSSGAKILFPGRTWRRKSTH
jgi:acyl transferase domain-containing protein